MHDITKLVAGFRELDLPNEVAVWLAYAIVSGQESSDFAERYGTFGQESLARAIKAIEARG